MIRRHVSRIVLSLESLDERITPAAGDLDPTFGVGGKVVTTVGPFNDYGNAVAIDGAGRIVVAGNIQVTSSSSSNSEFALARYNPDGSLDASFDGDGKLTTAIGTGHDEALGLALQSDGKIIAVGDSFNGSNSDFALIRYLTDGALDPTFGTGGKVVTAFGAADDYGYSVGIDGLGRIVVGGFTLNAGDSEFAVARYSASGVLDPTFGSGGKAITSFGPGGDTAYSLAIDSANRVVLAGRAHVGGNSGLAVVRFTANGVLDPTFGTGGTAVTPSIDQAACVAIDGSGRVVVAGTASSRFAVARYTGSGVLDPTFGSGGTVTTVFAENQLANQGATGIAIDGSGRIVVSGGDSGGNADFALARYTPTGALDTTFGDGGTVIQAIGTYSDFASGLVIDGSGSIVVAGGAYTSNLYDFTVARFSTNNPPDLSSTSAPLVYTENDGAVAIDPALTVTDSNDSNLIRATVNFVNYVSTQDVLGFTLPAGISGSFDASLGVLTLSGSSSLADYQDALRSLTYTNTSNSPLEQPRYITITVDDGEATFNISDSLTREIIVRPLNDAPSFTDDGFLQAVLQGTAEPAGQKVSTIFRGLFSDPDIGDTLSGVAVVGDTANPGTEGKWQYSSDNGSTWFDVGAVADNATALAVSAATRLSFKPLANFAGDPTPLVVRAIDSTFAGAYTIAGGRQAIDTSTNGGTSSISATTNLILTTVLPAGTGGNTPPTLSGVPISANIDEQQTLAFTASATDPDVGQVLAFRLVGAPVGVSIDPDSGAFTWTPTEAQGPDTFVLLVRVTDGFVNTDQSVTVTVREVNTAPSLADVPVALTTTRGSAVAFAATATDPDIIHGQGNTLTFTLVGGPAGAVIDPDTGAFAWTPVDTIGSGVYTFRVRVADDGVPSMSDSKILSITVADAAVVNGDLQIGGSFANDTITVNPSKDKSQLVVKLGRSMLGSFPLASVTGRIVVHALGGNDKVTISSKVTKPADLFGGSSNDILTGGAGDDRLFGEAGEDSLIGGKGNNLLVGGDGNDRLTGGTSRDVLIGGAGSDKVSGAAGDDLLIGGPTDFDTDLASLANIVAEWKSDSTYADRILHLKGTTGGANLSTFLSATTVHDDGVKDVLTGAAGTDWFVIGALDLTLGALKTETKTTF
ncbi:MAG TPA: putative Ig domain-containing protein [Gemmataceae bacterium]|jgi:uncharacterized delta-60 repeat protein|nr:putative Ig domain-containing protein [Gemmataceae bacterium]